MLARCWRRELENVPRLPCFQRGERLNGKFITKSSLKGLVSDRYGPGIPVVLSPETWTFRRISEGHTGPSDSQRPKVSAFWVMSSCICSLT